MFMNAVDVCATLGTMTWWIAMAVVSISQVMVCCNVSWMPQFHKIANARCTASAGMPMPAKPSMCLMIPVMPAVM